MKDSNADLEAIEAQYGRSTFVKEIAVLRLADSIQALYAVVVPDMAAAGRRRIANIGDLLRFELEGQSIHLPVQRRIQGYEIWFEPLPRTTTGDVDRAAIELKVRQRRERLEADANASPVAASALPDSRTAAIMDAVARRARTSRVRPESNLELDLGFDSMDRVELFAELEHRLGVKLPNERVHEILTVAQLVDAIPPGTAQGSQPVDDDAWRPVLRDLPSAADPMLRPVLRRYSVRTAILFALFRLIRLAMPRVVVSGREHLPTHGPYIICPNHQSYLDPFIVSSTLPFRIFNQLFVVGAAEYFATPLTAWLARCCKLLPVDPDANLVFAMQAAALGLKHQRILVLFPEGERSIDGTVKHFKKGAVVLSRHLDAPVVPVAVEGMFEVWPRNRRFNWKALLPWTGHRVRVTFGAPMRFPPNASFATAAKLLQERVTEMWAVTAAREQ